MNTTLLNKSPPTRMMSGAGAPRETLPGVIGATRIEPVTKTLGGLVVDTKLSPLHSSVYMNASAVRSNTERNIVGPAGMTRMPSAHYGQVPYAGMFIDRVGDKL